MAERTDEPRVLFRSRRQYALTLAVGYAVCIVLTGLFRHYGDPEKYPLLLTGGGLPRLAWSTFQVDPDGNPFESLTNWRAIITGDFSPIFDAAKGRRADPNFRMYQPEQLRRGSASFVYSPLTALAISPFARPGVSMYAAADWVSLLNHLMWAGTFVMLYAVVSRGRPQPFRDALLLGLHYLLFYPLAKALQLTQASVWIFFFLAASTYCLQRGRHLVAGLTLAVGVSIKPHLAAIPLVLALTPPFPRKVLMSCLLGLVLTAAASVAYAGWHNCRDYLFVTLPTLSAGYAFFPNKSLNGLLLRAFSEVDPAVFNLAPAVPWIQTASAVFALCVLASAAIVLRRRPHRPSPELDSMRFATALTAAVVASPVCWEHHLTAMFIPLCVGVSYLRLYPGQRRPWLDAALLCSFLLTGFFFDSRYLGGWPIGLLSGLEFYGSLLLLLCLLCLSRRASLAEADAVATR